jgi:uncharacterized caspase-like protein
MSYRAICIVAILLWGTAAAIAENRLALVIGNSSYETVTVLPNPANDARAMTDLLKAAGFDVVAAPNLAQNEMRQAISNFAGMVAAKGPDTVALVFYAGHGLQVDGDNFLVPIDARIQREADVPLQAMRLGDVMNMLAAVPSKARIVILDACRNNPFSEINKTSGRGLAIVDAPTGSLVSYSTAPGTEALDGDGANSPYTTALMKIGQEQGLPIEQALKRVRLAVNDATGRHQTPWESSSLTSEFAFFPGASAHVQLASAVPATAPAVTRSETRSVEAWQKELKTHSAREAYETVIREDQVEAYQAYLTLYPAQSLAPSVRSLVERRREMIAWHDAVTINTVASYQAFLASWGNSDFFATANRLIARTRSHPVSNAFSAYASAGPTCPCSLPNNNNATPRQKRADLAPASNDPGNRGGGGGGGNSSGGGGGGTGVVTTYTPPSVIDPATPPPVLVMLPPRRHLPPYTGGDKPTGGKSSGGDKPTGDKSSGDYPKGDGSKGNTPKGSKGGDYPGRHTDSPTRGIDKTRLARLHDDTPRVRDVGSSGRFSRIERPVITRPAFQPRMTNGFAPRGGMMMGRGMSMAPRPALGGLFMRRRFF